MKKIHLKVLDRLLISSILPQQGGKIEMITAKSIVDMIEFKPDEISELEMKDNEKGGVSWKVEKDFGKEFSLTAEQLSMLKLCAKELDESRQVSLQNLSLIQLIEKM